MTNGHESSAQLKQLEAENQELRRQLESKNRECGDQANANLRYEQAVVWVLKIGFCICCLIFKPFNIYSFLVPLNNGKVKLKDSKIGQSNGSRIKLLSFQIQALPFSNNYNLN